jgi:hypothetical protein
MKRRERASPPTRGKEAAHEAVLKDLFSFREITNKAHFRCRVDGPTELDVLFESVLDEVFGCDPSSDYKCWVRKLYRLGLISRMPTNWKASKDPENERFDPRT